MTIDRLLILILTFTIISCGSRFDGETTVIGKEAALDSDKNIISLREDSTWRKIELKGDTTKYYGGLEWSNTSDDFLTIEYSRNENGRLVEGDIVKVNQNGELVEKIVDNKPGKLIWGMSLSKNDNKLLFGIKLDYFDPENPLAQLDLPISYFIMDYKKNEIVKKLDTVALSKNIWINNRPWLKDENRFIYDFRTDRKMRIADDKSENEPTGESGIYLYNTETDEYSLLIPGGYSGEVSPTVDKIAYLKDKGIWVYDVDSKSHELLYTLNKKESTASVEWTPDGNYVYFVSYEDYFYDLFFNSYQTLIRLTDKKLLKINHKNRYK